MVSVCLYYLGLLLLSSAATVLTSSSFSLLRSSNGCGSSLFSLLFRHLLIHPLLFFLCFLAYSLWPCVSTSCSFPVFFSALDLTRLCFLFAFNSSSYSFPSVSLISVEYFVVMCVCLLHLFSLLLCLFPCYVLALPLLLTTPILFIFP